MPPRDGKYFYADMYDMLTSKVGYDNYHGVNALISSKDTPVKLGFDLNQAGMIINDQSCAVCGNSIYNYKTSPSAKPIENSDQNITQTIYVGAWYGSVKEMCMIVNDKFKV